MMRIGTWSLALSDVGRERFAVQSLDQTSARFRVGYQVSRVQIFQGSKKGDARNGFGQQTPDRSFVAASGASGMPRSHEGALSGSLGAAISIRASDGLAGNAKWPAKRPSHGTSSERATKPQRGLPSLPSSARRQTLEQPAKKSLPVRDATLPRAPRCTRSVVCTYEADRLAKDPHLKSVMHAPRYSPASYGFPRPHATRACPEIFRAFPRLLPAVPFVRAVTVRGSPITSASVHPGRSGTN
ncbi:uncharacterized protein CCOS01_16337 [Colletotrichum costaricense]|uniref:Uncharacterized protein n=1 Tax=Colletotrichum costaricense TaxID=1209916 RepID=A0AAJ0DSH1_9PEZI|nr:uncharacterized protein CCOS01_16337 [Colletotrichum costaricense]KAK1507078.1 hypothetical protein CCOS01_16337 [Colletotrichum costaricense]